MSLLQESALTCIKVSFRLKAGDLKSDLSCCLAVSRAFYTRFLLCAWSARAELHGAGGEVAQGTHGGCHWPSLVQSFRAELQRQAQDWGLELI